MINLHFNYNNHEGLNIILLGAHCDDIEIGCGGTLLKLFDNYKINSVKWIVFASSESRKKEAADSANTYLKEIPNKEIMILDYSDALLDQKKIEIKSVFESLKNDLNPHIIFTHYRDDRHQDHRLISDLTWNTFRNHFILEYEIPKYDGDLGIPNTFVNLTKEYAERKIELLLTHFKSQSEKHWFDKETFQSLMRIRGLEGANKNKYSEAFYARKIIL